MAIFLRYFADLSYAEIGEVLGVCDGTVAATTRRTGSSALRFQPTRWWRRRTTTTCWRALRSARARASPGDWDDVLDRARAVARGGDRSTGFRMPRRPRLVVVRSPWHSLAVLLASALAVRAFVLDKGFIGLPPVGATPSTPEDGELVLHWMVRSVTLGGIQSRAWVYADGRIVWSRHEGPPPPEGVDQVACPVPRAATTPDGVELLRSRLVASGLFDSSRKFIVPEEHGSAWGFVEIHNGDKPVRLSLGRQEAYS